jgi:hypothetical protein
LLLAVLVAVATAEIIGFRHYRSDMAAWRAVQQSLANLHSALERKSADELPRSIANDRAAVDAFAAAAHRFPRDHRARVQAAESGLRYLTIAADDAQEIQNWQVMAAYPDVTKLLPRGCDGDHLGFSPALITEAFTVSGSYLIREAVTGATGQEHENWQRGFYPPLDLAKETAACQRLHQASLRLATDAKPANTPAHPVRWKYRVEVSNPTGCLLTPYSDGQPLPIPYAAGKHFYVDANVNARLEKVFCKSGKPADAIGVTVNGQRCDPVWLLDDSGVNYATQLAPLTPAIMPVGDSH